MPFFGSLGTFGLSRLAVFVPPVVNPLTNSGSGDVLVVKYNSDGIPLWARRVGGTLDDGGGSMSTDSSGNIVVTGFYTSNPLNIFDANGSTVLFTLTNANTSKDSFIVKYDSSGTPLWVRRIGATGSDSANSVDVDSSGNVIVAGDFTSNVNIYAANGTTVSFTLTGSDNAFVVKYDSSGTPLWVRRISGSSGDQISRLNVDSSGNVIVTGYYFSNPLVINGANETTSAFTLGKSGQNDSFVVKYDSSGTPLWARRLGGTDNDFASSVTTDSSGNVIVTGSYFSSLNIFAANDSTSAFTLTTSAGSTDVFVVKYNSSGTPLWARRMSGTGDDGANSVTTDSSGNVIVFARYNSTTLNIHAANNSVSFSLANSSLAAGENDSVVVKYDSSGTPLWVRRIGGTRTEFAVSVGTDSSGNIVVTGFYTSNPLNIFAANGSTILFTLTNANTNNDGFIVKYDSSGTPLWARKIGATGSDSVNSVDVDSSGNVIVAGNYTSTSLSFN